MNVTFFRSRRLSTLTVWLSVAVAVLLAGVAYVSYGDHITPRGIIVHHSTLPITVQGVDYFNPSVGVLDSYHETRGFWTFFEWRLYHVGYHFMIYPNGQIERGRPENCRGAHTKSFNDYLGICLIGDFSRRDNPDGARGPEVPSPEQWKALLTLTSSLMKKYHLPVRNVLGHREVSSHTECPGDRIDLEGLREQLRFMRPR